MDGTLFFPVSVMSFREGDAGRDTGSGRGVHEDHEAEGERPHRVA